MNNGNSGTKIGRPKNREQKTGTRRTEDRDAKSGGLGREERRTGTRRMEDRDAKSGEPGRNDPKV